MEDNRVGFAYKLLLNGKEYTKGFTVPVEVKPGEVNLEGFGEAAKRVFTHLLETLQPLWEEGVRDANEASRASEGASAECTPGGSA